MPTSAVIENKQAHFRYHVLETWEAGLVLTGQEVKAIRGGRCELKAAYVVVRVLPSQGRQPSFVADLINAYIPPYDKAGPLPDYDPRRPRRLLFKRRELTALFGRAGTSGLTLVPLRVYTHARRLKVLVGLARGKSDIDKRETIRRRELNRELRRHVSK